MIVGLRPCKIARPFVIHLSMAMADEISIRLSCRSKLGIPTVRANHPTGECQLHRQFKRAYSSRSHKTSDALPGNSSDGARRA
jgi:hypothetical protein